MNHQQDLTDEKSYANPKESMPLRAVTLVAIGLVLGLGGGMAALYGLSTKDQSTPRISRKVDESSTVLGWLTGNDKESTKQRSKKKKYGPFDSVFGQESVPPPVIQGPQVNLSWD